MLKVSLIEFFLRGIPEEFIFLLAAYAFTKNKIKLDKYLISVLVQSLIVYLLRFLPIQSGVDSILNLITLIGVMVIINKFEVVQSIKVSIIMMLCVFICEGLNVLFLQLVLKKDLNSLFKSPISKIIYSSPSLILFATIVIIYYIRLAKRKELNYISYGEVN
ncbi:hypothetical protein JHL18_03725 [Clostridium sp. YIM B02505]|uniref:CAAX protease self-immunity n=1 Tax=Clostridium yunnanense TaxID=2800325 RepID=A0ABS1EK52_9CLOT|nr:hypothetical protein [Clostridium yunnanense]MBK1809748.1 hypothetical protein [Clostridium yunnanense]